MSSRPPTGVLDQGTRPSVNLTISIDTEEDNWVPSRSDITARNIFELPKLAVLFDHFGVRPTYFTTYQVAANPDAAAIMRELSQVDGTEIGAHLHPWNTPPDCGIESDVSMLLSYPVSAQEAKLDALVSVLRDQLRVDPLAFRAGRFGIGSGMLNLLSRRGFRVDSSVTPLLSWRAFGGPSFLSAPSVPYWLGRGKEPSTSADDGDLVEVPVTVGYTHFRPSSWSRIARLMGAPVARALRMGGLAGSVGLFRRVIMSPESDEVEDMLRISRTLIEHGMGHLHMYFHSSSLLPGLTPFTRTAKDVDRLYGSIRRYLESLSVLAHVTFRNASEVGEFHVRGLAPDGHGMQRGPAG